MAMGSIGALFLNYPNFFVKSASKVGDRARKPCKLQFLPLKDNVFYQVIPLSVKKIEKNIIVIFFHFT